VPIARHDVLVVVPTYDEAENIVPLTGAVLEHGVRVLVVDDNSPDGTGDIADVLAASHDRLAVLHRAEKGGLGPAYADGFRHGLEAGALVLCEMDADFSHDPAHLPGLLVALDAGADVVIGSRYVPGGGVSNWPWHRRWLSKGGNVYARAMLGTRIADMTGGYRAFTADAIRRLEPWNCEASGYGFQVEMAWKAESLGLRVAEVPISFVDRVRGQSKMSTSIAVEAMRLVTKWGLGKRRGRLPWPTPEVT
jgi:dolichol-phosphate mannosyltransferase